MIYAIRSSRNGMHTLDTDMNSAPSGIAPPAAVLERSLSLSHHQIFGNPPQKDYNKQIRVPFLFSQRIQILISQIMGDN